jgi:hypothetical protein
MKPRPDPIDELYAQLMRAGEQPGELQAFLDRHGSDVVTLMALLRRAVPVRLLELVAASATASRELRVLAVVVLNPRTPRVLAQRLLPSLLWRDLADVAATARVDAGVRVRAEELLREQIPDLRLGDRATLARVATPPVLSALLSDSEPKVAEACLLNPRLREEDLLIALRRPLPPRALLEAAAASPRWRDSYAVRLALVLQPRTPLALALGQLSSLLPRDLERVAHTEGLAPLIHAAAERLCEKAPSSGEA